MISVFMYHDIRGENKYPKRYNLKSFLSVNNFKNHLKYINNKFKVIEISDIPNVIKDKNGDYAVLTFDDGLKDHYNITELLLSYNNSGAFLIPTLPITSGKMIHSHKIQFILASMDEDKLTKLILDKSDNPNELYEQYSKPKIKNNWWSKNMIFITFFLRNSNNGIDITNKLFYDIVTKDEAEFCDDFYLNEKNIMEMVSAGMKIGGHGYTSAILTNDNQSFEISKSIDFISNFHSDDIFFSYPNGIYGETTINLLKKLNCKFSFTTEPVSIIDGNIDYLKLPRYDGAQTILI